MSQAKSVWVAGEVLIDLITTGAEQKAVIGGGAANTARALAGLGVPTAFVGGISNDEFGQSAEVEFSASGVDLELALRSELPTACAFIDLSAGQPSYKFQLDKTATFAFHSDWLPSGAPIALHIGSLATIIKSGSKELLEWASAVAAPIIFDPNVRPSVLEDAAEYREAVTKWFAIADIVKLSEEDLEFLYRGRTGATSEASIISQILNYGPNLVVLTRGSHGISAFTSSGVISVPGVRVEVIDTIGAGDTVGAVLLESIAKYGLDGLCGDWLFATLTRAVRAAAITCSRAGAQPPKASELD